MSKFRKNRETPEIITPKAKEILDSAPDSIPEAFPAPKVEEKPKMILVSVPLEEDAANMLAHLSQVEDRSQRKISSRLLTQALKNEMEKSH